VFITSDLKEEERRGRGPISSILDAEGRWLEKNAGCLGCPISLDRRKKKKGEEKKERLFLPEHAAKRGWTGREKEKAAVPSASDVEGGGEGGKLLSARERKRGKRPKGKRAMASLAQHVGR